MAAIDEGHHDIAIRNLLRTVCQTNVTIKESKADHRLATDTHKVRSLGMMNELLVQIKALMLVVTRGDRNPAVIIL